MVEESRIVKTNKETIEKGMRATIILLAIMIYVPATPTIATTPIQSDKSRGDAAQERVPVRRVLDEQVKAWNAGKLEEFMKSYWHSEELTFFSGARRLNGWEATLERYRKTYQADGKEMGELAFANLDITLLGPESAFARGEYHLTFRDGRKATGIYTLVLRRFKDGWKIIHDHTSAAQ